MEAEEDTVETTNEMMDSSTIEQFFVQPMHTLTKEEVKYSIFCYVFVYMLPLQVCFR